MQTLISFLPYRVRVLVKLFFATFCSTPKSTRCFSWFFSSIFFFFASRLFGRRSQWCAMWHIVQRHIGCSTKRNEIQLDDNNFLWTQIIFIGYIWMDMDRTCSIGIAYYDLSVNLVWLFSPASVRPISCSLYLFLSFYSTTPHANVSWIWHWAHWLFGGRARGTVVPNIIRIIHIYMQCTKRWLPPPPPNHIADPIDRKASSMYNVTGISMRTWRVSYMCLFVRVCVCVNVCGTYEKESKIEEEE